MSKNGIRTHSNLIKLKASTFNTPKNLKKLNQIVSLDKPISSGTSLTSKGLFFSDILPSSIPTPYEIVEKNDEIRVVNEAILSLEEDEQDIITRRFIGNETLESIANSYDVSKQWVAMQEKTILDKLKNKLTEKL